MAGDAYRETLTSVDGFTRDARGRVKFHKDTKKRRRDADGAENGDGDVEMADGTLGAGGESRDKRAKKNKPVKVGQEFKAKKAGGDIKRGGVDPYAYVSLAQAAKGGRGKGGQKVTVTGRR